MTKLPEMRQLSDSSDQGVVYGYTKEQMPQFQREALDEAIERITSIREGWGDEAEEFGMNTAIIQILELKGET